MFGNAKRTPPVDRRMSARVHFDEPAMSTDRLLEALSRQTRVRLICAPEVRDEILLLHVRDRPLPDVMARIADVAGARWRQVGETWGIERPAEMARAQQERDVRVRAAIIAPSLKQHLSALQQPWNEVVLRAAISLHQDELRAGHVHTELNALDPVYRSFLRCLSDISPDAIARIPAGGRAVFATKPTPMQRPLGNGAQVALAKLLEEQQLFGTTLRAGGMKDGFEDGSLAESIHSDHEVWRRLNPYRTPAVRALLIVERQWGTNYQARLILLDTNCKAVVKFDLPHDTLIPPVPQDMSPISRKGPAVPLSATTRTLLSIQRQGDAKLHVSPAALRVLTEPEHYEPLGMLVSDGYTALGRATNRDVIAAVPDSLFEDTLLYADNARLTLDDVRNWPRYDTPMHIVDSSGWLTVTPPYPYEARSCRANRSALGVAFRRVAHRGSWDIEDLAEILANSGDSARVNFSREYLWAVSRGAFEPGVVGGDELLALYGTLTRGQQDVLISGRPLPYSQLDKRQRLFAEKAVYGTQGSRAIVKALPAPSGFEDLYSEPTEGFPDGLTANGAIRASRKRERIVYFRSADQRPDEQSYWWMRERPHGGYEGPKPRIPAGGYPAFRYDVRYRTTVSVSVDVTPWLGMGAEYSEPVLPTTGPPLPLEDLPPDVQKRVNEELLWIRQLRDEAPMSRT